MRPALAIVAVVAVVLAVLASKGVAFPVALAGGLPVLAIGVLGSNPFPNNAVALFAFSWLGLAVLFLVTREEGALPLRVLLSPPLLLTIAFACWLLFRLTGSPAPEYGSFKLQLFLAQGVMLLFAGILVARRREQLDLFVVLTLVLATASAIVLARSLAAGNAQGAIGERFALSSAQNPIELGRHAAEGLIAATFVLLAARNVTLRLAALVAAPLIVVPFIAAGSRGPVVGLAAALLVLLTLASQDRAARRRVLLVAVVAALGCVLVTRLVPGEDVQRSLSVLGGSEQGLNSTGRTDLWHEAWTAFLDHPVAGLGTGGYASVNPDQRYPHNIFLEIGAELGFVGLVLFAAVLGAAVRGLAIAWRRAGTDRRQVALVAALLTAALVNAQFSSDVAGNEAVWLAAGLSTGLALRTERRGGFGRLRRRGREEQHGLPAPAQPGFALRRRPGAITRPAAGSVVEGVVTVSADPADTGWGIASVEVEFSANGDEWQSLGRVEEQPFDVYALRGGHREHVAVVRTRRLAEELGASLPDGATAEIVPSRRRPWQTGAAAVVDWDTTGLVGGEYELRVVTADVTGARVESESVAVTVAAGQPVARAAQRARPGISVEVDELGEYLRGRVQLQAAVSGSGTATVTLEVRSGAEWTPVATARREPYTLAIDTTELADGPHGLRVRARAADGDVAVVDLGERTVDNTPPICELVAPQPGEHVTGIVKVRAVAHDDTSGVKSLLFQFAGEGTEWRPVVTAGAARSIAEWNVSTLDPGSYSLRVVGFDNAQNTAVSEAVPVVVDAPPPPEQESDAWAPAKWRLWQLEKILTEQPHEDPYVQADRAALVFELRTWSEPDGTLPVGFDQLLWETFGDPPTS